MKDIGKSNQISNYELIETERKKIWIPLPDQIPKTKIIERPEIIEQTLAAWMTISNLPPLNFQLYGPPGTGKNTIVYELARILKKDLYVLNGHNEISSEDIACSATMTSSGSIEYVASPLFAAMLRGGIFFFDEIGKATSEALNPLASVLDERRALHSILASIKIKAHKDFLFCAALNEKDNRENVLPDFIDERLSPSIYVGNPDFETLKKILNVHMPQRSYKWISSFLEEFKDHALSPRVAIKILSFSYKLAMKHNNQKPTKEEIRKYLQLGRRNNMSTKEETLSSTINKFGNDDEFYKSIFN